MAYVEQVEAAVSYRLELSQEEYDILVDVVGGLDPEDYDEDERDAVESLQAEIN